MPLGVPGSDPVWQATFLIDWDTANKRIVCFAFENTGGHQVIDDWEIQGDKVTAKGKGSDPFCQERLGSRPFHRPSVTARSEHSFGTNSLSIRRREFVPNECRSVHQAIMRFPFPN